VRDQYELQLQRENNEINDDKFAENGRIKLTIARIVEY
jgi:hypothetical protein